MPERTTPEARAGLTPAERSARARIAAHARWAKHDPTAGTAPARAAFNAKFVEAIRAEHPDLPETEIQRRAESARRAHLARISFEGLKTRRKNAAARRAAQRKQNGGAR